MDVDTGTLASLIPDLTALASIQLPKYELPPGLSAAFGAILEQLRSALPPNWPPGVDEDTVFSIVQNEGIPLVWVPRADIVDAIIGERRAATLVWTSWSTANT